MNVQAELGDVGDGDDVVAVLDALEDDGPAAVAAADEADVELLVGAEGA